MIIGLFTFSDFRSKFAKEGKILKNEEKRAAECTLVLWMIHIPGSSGGAAAAGPRIDLNLMDCLNPYL